MADKKDLFNSVFHELADIQLSPEFFYEEAEDIDKADRRYEREEAAIREYARKMSKNIAKELKRAKLSIDDYLKNRNAYFAENIFHKAKFGKELTEEEFYQNKIEDDWMYLSDFPQEDIMSDRQHSFEHSTSKNKFTFDNLNKEFKHLQDLMESPVIQNSEKLTSFITNSMLLNVSKFNLAFDNKDKPYLPELVKYNETAVYETKKDIIPNLLHSIKSLTIKTYLGDKSYDLDKAILANKKYDKLFASLGLDVDHRKLLDSTHPDILEKHYPINSSQQFRELLSAATVFGKIPWDKNISPARAFAPFNYETGRQFSHFNLIATSLHMAVIDSNDPRYLSEDKIKDAGLSLKDNALPFKADYKSVAKDGSYQNKTVTLYNAKDIEGLPPLALPKTAGEHTPTVKAERVNDPTDQVSNNMAGFIAALSLNKGFEPVALNIKMETHIYKSLASSLPYSSFHRMINAASVKAAEITQTPKPLQIDPDRQTVEMEM
jgi:hypothetical protein